MTTTGTTAASAAPDRRASRWRPVFAAGLAVLVVLHTVRPTGVIGDATYLAVAIGAAVVAWIGALLWPRGHRFASGCIALAVTVSGIGDLVFGIRSIDGTSPGVSVSDLLWLSGHVLIGVGLVTLLVERDADRRIDIDGLIDMTTYVVLALMVVSQVPSLDRSFTGTDLSFAQRLINAAYPVLGATLLALLLRSLVTRRLSGSAGILLSIGIACALAADVSLLLDDGTRAQRSVWQEFLWLAAATLMGLSAWPDRAPGASPNPATQVTGTRVLIGLVPLLVPGFVELSAYQRGRDINPIPWLVVSAVLILLVFVRTTRLLRLRDRQQAELESGRRYYHALADNSADAVVVIGPGDLITNDSPQLAKMLGRPGTIPAGTHLIRMLHPQDQEQAEEVLARMRSATGVLQSELRMRHDDGTDRWFAARSVNLTDDPAVRGLVINLQDVTDRKQAEDQLTHRAFHDSLTGLANRALFRDRIDHALRRTARTGDDIAVIYLDLDGFKTVNDSRGHESGDEVLREVAQRLQAAVRTADTVARLGGDEFAILIEQTARPLDKAGTVADRILQSLTTPIHLADQQIVLSASIGIAISDPDSTASSMLRDADIAMYRAKSTGKGRWTSYDPQMRAAAIERLELQTDLITALADEQFGLVYQPIIELETETVAAFEALLRWHHPTRGTIQPDIFIGLLEESGAILDVGAWVLAEACRTAAGWHALHPTRGLAMTVNLSPRQVAIPDIIGHVATALADSGFPPEQLILELTESVLVEDAPLAAQRLQELHELGVRLAIDDFGTGYSSLSYLRQFPVDILKIDRSFTNTITPADTVPAIIRGLLDLGKTLQLTTIAEGIEHQVQRDSLRDQHCDYGQGFFFAGPLTERQAQEYLQNRPPEQTDTVLNPLER